AGADVAGRVRAGRAVGRRDPDRLPREREVLDEPGRHDAARGGCRLMATTETVHKLLIGGQWYETGDLIDVTSPYDGSVVGHVAYGGADDARRAIDAAEEAMRTPIPAHKRAAVLDGVAELLRERRDEFARTIAEEAGKPLTTAGIE